MPRLPHFAEPGIRNVSASILRITEGVPLNVLFTTNSSVSSRHLYTFPEIDGSKTKNDRQTRFGKGNR